MAQTGRDAGNSVAGLVIMAPPEDDGRPGQPPKTGQLDNLLGHLLRQAFLAGQRAFLQTYPDREITPLVYGAVELIRDNPGISHNTVCGHLGVAKSVLTTALKPLQNKGYILRRRNTNDGRTASYALSKSGATWFMPLRDRIARAETDLAAPLSQAEQDQLKILLRRIAGRPHDR